MCNCAQQTQQELSPEEDWLQKGLECFKTTQALRLTLCDRQMQRSKNLRNRSAVQ